MAAASWIVCVGPTNIVVVNKKSTLQSHFYDCRTMLWRAVKQQLYVIEYKATIELYIYIR